MAERNYDFRRRLDLVHVPRRRDLNIEPQESEVAIEDGWSIIISNGASPLVLNVAKDLQDYLLVSMNVSTLILPIEDVSSSLGSKRSIILGTKDELPGMGKDLSVPRSYRIICDQEWVMVCGNDERGVGQGSYYLETLMNLKEAPILPIMDTVRKPLFSPRMVHSGWGLDEFPDSHISAIAHAGMDSILVFVKGVDSTPKGYMDFNDLIHRAGLFGLDVYAYSYLKSLKHPDEPDAEAYYQKTYGELFRACPGFKGVVLVGESVEFPSKDASTTQTLRQNSAADGLPAGKPSPGWWPCYDYPEWLNMIKKVIRGHSPNADIVFWTYNWGWAPEEDRVALIRSLPEDITLLVTFEMFEQIKRQGITNVCVDYTISFEGPGHYFISEAEAAYERGIRLYTMSNTAGLTWDFGVVPYIPVPYQWGRRHKALLKARDDYGLSGLMESHHYGWWPSFVNELANWAYWSPSPPEEDICEAIAKRDFGPDAAPLVIETWQDWSRAMRDYIPTNEDQYGPFRIGPSYPFVFRGGVTIPAAWHAMFGNRIIHTRYEPRESPRQSPGPSRIHMEIKSLKGMSSRWKLGIERLEEAIDLMPDKKKAAGESLLRLGEFIYNSILTAIHIKEWWKAKQRLFLEEDPDKANAILDEMLEIAQWEMANVEATIPLTETDSRLGWEPSMEYMTDPAHLRWKIRQLQNVIDGEIPSYRRSLDTLGRGD
jgi:hypothetical protein